MQTLAAAIAEFRAILDRNPLSDLTEAHVSPSAPAGSWSRQQILGHLLDSASNNHQRFVRAQIENNLSFPGYLQNQWVSVQHYEKRDWQDLVSFWTAYNRHLLFLMEQTPVERLENRCRIGDGEPVTLEFLMVDYVRHLKHHLAQISAE